MDAMHLGEMPLDSLAHAHAHEATMAMMENRIQRKGKVVSQRFFVSVVGEL